ncbi:hypothetical protein JCM3774_004344 [Rhodotorula dairenensis]
MLGFTFWTRKATRAVPQPAQARTPPIVDEKTILVIGQNEKDVPSPPAYETVVVAVPPAYAPTDLFPTRDRDDRPVLSTRPRRSIRTPANLDMSAGAQLPVPARSDARCFVVTSKPTVAGFEVSKHLGLVQASATSLAELKLLLRLQGEERRAFAILDVVISTGDNSTFTAAGRAVRLRKA